jgi:transposase
MKRKNDTRNLTQIEQDIIREKAVLMVKTGETQTKTAKLLGVSRQSVNVWYNNYLALGRKSFKSKKRGNPQEPKLKGYQAATIVNMIKDKHPEQLKLPFVLWTREAVQKLIKNKFDIDVSLKTVGKYLSRWGFTSQKPYKTAQERNPKLVEEWLKSEYPKIKEKAKNQKASIFWGDETGLKSTHLAGKSYSPKGKTPEVKTSAKRFAINIVSAITNSGKLYFKTYTGTFSSKVFIAFLNRLIKQVKRKIFLIVDNLSVHKSKEVMKWINSHKRKIELFFLPPYSPDINPDELLNQDLKANIYKTKRPEDGNELKSMVISKLKDFQANFQKIQNYFNAEKVSYAKAS